MTIITTRDGTELYTKVWGEGRLVVLIHGWPLSSDSWDPISLHLANNGFKVVAYDRRGFGRSDQPWKGYDYDTLSDDLADVMKETGVEGDAAIVGFSMGGGEVARYMTRHQGKGVTRAGLISSVVPFMKKTDDNPDGVDEETLGGMVAGMKEDRQKFMRGFLKDFFGVGALSHPVSDAKLDWAWGLCMQAGLWPTLACANAFANTDFRPDLPNFKVPTLVIHGTKDVTVPIDATGRAAAKGIAQAELIEYDGEPHGLFARQEEKLKSDLTAFLQR